jgi:hypothetical protein
MACLVARWLAPILASVVAGLNVDAAPQLPEGPPAAPPDVQTSAPPQESRQPWDEKTLRRFASAFATVEVIQKKISEQLGQMTDSRRIAEVKATSDAQISRAIRAEGLTVDQFDRIAAQLASDPELRTRVERMTQQGR